MRIDFNKLRIVIKNPSSRMNLASNSSVCMSEFTASLTNYIEHNHVLYENELAMLTISMEDWIKKRSITKIHNPINIGDIFYADLGIL